MENKQVSKYNYKFYINNTQTNKQQFKHKNNKVSTTKYNIITFLPKALLIQFFRLANVYFLIIAIIQSISIISPLSPSTAVAPLAIVLFVSIVREGYEDFIRYRFDKSLNIEKVTVYRDGAWKETVSQSLHIGELVLVKEDQTFPADLILIDSNMQEGLCYIETGTLDGEKAPKLKLANKEIGGNFGNGDDVKSELNITGMVNTTEPNKDLYYLAGNMTLQYEMNGQKVENTVAITAKQLLLKGAILRSTKWIIGTVIYTGHNTKLIKNSGVSRVKFSRVEKLMSKLLIAVLFLQMCFCILAAGLNSFYYNEYVRYAFYLPPPEVNPIIDSLISYFTYMLLLNTMIPISLIITLEIAK